MYLKHCFVTSNVEYFRGDIQEIIKSHRTIKYWAYILHDKDDTANHYHIYLNFGNSGVDTKQVGEWFGLQESQVERIRGRRVNALEYLTHSNNKEKNKYQYSSSEVVANFDFQTEIENSKILGDFQNFSYAQQLEYVNTLPVSEKASAFSKLEKLWRLHCQWLTLTSDRKIDVIFICGRGGTGKTFYAKKLLKSLGYDYCVSSSSNDPFQDYLGQNAIILDDLRDKSFEFEDLLKILDNNTGSSIRSRFSNKVFNGKMIIITTTVPLWYWYSQYKTNSNDTLSQLYRRISCYVEVTYDEIAVYEEIGQSGHPSGVAKVFKNELIKLDKKSTRKINFGALFEKICEPVTTDIFSISQMEIPIKK